MLLSSVSSVLILMVTLTSLSMPVMIEADMPQHTSGAYNISEMIDSLLRGYDNRVRPNFGGPPVDVGVTMYILGVSSISEKRMEFTMDFYFRQFWKDNRLVFTPKPGVDSLPMGAELAKNIWVPDTFFSNEKSAIFHSVPTPNIFTKISSTGDVTRSVRLTVTASCPMNLQNFPMDRQLCALEIESYGHTMRDIRYNWKAGDNSIGISPEVQLPQFKVVGHRQRDNRIFLSTGNYSRLSCEIQFSRYIGYYVIHVYIPSIIIVAMSWVTFWLNRNATPARVVLGVTTVLSMLTLICFTNADAPKVSYIKSIDIFLGTCFLMVFVALLEFATVGYVGKRIQMNKLRAKATDQKKPLNALKGQNNHTENANGPELECRKQTQMDDPETGADSCDRIYGVNPTLLDKYSRIVFPVVFTCFNALYWIIYVNISNNKEYNLIINTS